MNTLACSSASAARPAPRGPIARLGKRAAPLGGVLMVHLVVFYAFYSGLMTRMAEKALPQAVYVSFVTPPQPEAAPEPKTVPVTQLPPPLFQPPVIPVPVVPVLPVVLPTPVERTITVAPQLAAPSEKPAAPVVMAPVAVAAPAAAPVTGPKTLTSGVEYLQAPQPVYPPMAKRLGEQGKVILRILVNERGIPDQVLVQTSSGSARLDEAGRQAALRALFKPHVEDGRAVAVYVIVPLNFQLAT